MPAMNHVHTYVKYKSKPGYFRCDAPDCTYFIDKERIVNKNSLCTLCGQEFQLTREDLKRSRPRCLNCSETEAGRRHRKAQDLTRELGTEAFNPFLMPKQMDFDTEEEEETRPNDRL